MSISLAVVEFIKNVFHWDIVIKNEQSSSLNKTSIDIEDGSLCICPSVDQQVEQHTGISANYGSEMAVALTIDTCTLSCCSQCPHWLPYYWSNGTTCSAIFRTCLMESR